MEESLAGELAYSLKAGSSWCLKASSDTARISRPSRLFKKWEIYTAT